MQPDLRLCPAPNCGGFFVALLNRQSVGCPGGGLGAMCRVTAIDWSRLGLDPAARSDFEKAALAGRAVVRGELQLGALGAGSPRPTARLVVTEGWIAAGGRLPRGGFFQVAGNGIVCVTVPCFSWRQTLLNTNRRGEISGVDLLGAGAPEASRNAAWTELGSGSILVAGRLRNVPDAGPAGAGVELVASQFYLPVGGS
ncbi:MAG TPA: DUF6748 domain-containing protein [Thermoanaerobaculia bacterium]|nr:DUF6748 domain-containing protein [Thermoanaerobaculia bacterium]